jgi:pyruvate dehydrogenase E2 component (dihydrolipoamide acetyltransferase)
MQFLLPDLGEGIQEAQVLRLLVAEGDTVAADQPLMEVETDKAAVEIPSPVAGKVTRLHVTEGEVVNVGMPLVTFDGEGEALPAPEPSPAPPPAATRPATTPSAPTRAPAPPAPVPAAPPRAPAHVRAAPVVRKLAHRLGVDLARVSGTGPRGRILRDDVRRAAETGTAPAAASPEPLPSTAPPAPPPGVADADRFGPVRRQPLTQIRKTIAARMTRSVSSIPHVTNFEDADVTDVDRLRRDHNEANPERKLTLMAFLVRAVTRSLRRYPVFNAVFDAENQEIVYKEYVNIGVAVDSERGLVVPVMRNVEALDLAGVAAALRTLAAKVRDVSFAVEELRGSSFTISNAGTAGGNRYATPIINHQETAILSVARAPSRATWTAS